MPEPSPRERLRLSWRPASGDEEQDLLALCSGFALFMGQAAVGALALGLLLRGVPLLGWILAGTLAFGAPAAAVGLPTALVCALRRRRWMRPLAGALLGLAALGLLRLLSAA